MVVSLGRTLDLPDVSLFRDNLVGDIGAGPGGSYQPPTTVFGQKMYKDPSAFAPPVVLFHEFYSLIYFPFVVCSFNLLMNVAGVHLSSGNMLVLFQSMKFMEEEQT